MLLRYYVHVMLITVVLSLVELRLTKDTTFHDLILSLVYSFPFPYYLFSQDLEIPFECTYPNQAEASLIQMNITNAKVIFLAPDDGSGMFDLDLNIYKVRMKGQGDYVVRRDALIYQSA